MLDSFRTRSALPSFSPPKEQPASTPFVRSLVSSGALIAAGLCCFSLSCTPGARKQSQKPEVQASPQQQKQAAPAPEQENQATLPLPQGKEVSFERQLRHLEKVRGLSPRGEVHGLELSADELLAHIKRALAFERPPEVMQGTEAMLRDLELVPADFDLEQTMLALLSENLAGLYEPRLKLMMIRKDLPAQIAEVTLLHELVHALQDQYYDLEDIVTSSSDDSDRSTALSCLAEGDATSTMLDGVLPDGKTALDMPEGSIEAQFFAAGPSTAAPPVIIRSLFAPYIDGLNFVHALRRRGGFAEVDRVWKRPPISSEQVLHLEKYDNNEAPIDVAIPAPPSAEWKELLHDIWGEQSLRISLEEWVSKKEAKTAAAGWGGDRIVAYQQGEQTAVAWQIQLDTEQDAAELWKAISKKATKLESAEGTQAACRHTIRGEHSVAVALHKKQVFLVGGPEKAAVDSTQCKMTHGWLMTLLPELKAKTESTEETAPPKTP